MSALLYCDTELRILPSVANVRHGTGVRGSPCAARPRWCDHACESGTGDRV